METKRYLEQIERYDELIKNCLDDIQRLRDMVVSITVATDKERVDGSPNQDKIGSMVGRIKDLTDELAVNVEKYADARKTIIEQINGIENTKYYKVLYRRYVKYEDLCDIADDMQYSYDNIMKLHSKSIKTFERLYGRNYKKA